jgi:hypothetical protein
LPPERRREPGDHPTEDPYQTFALAGAEILAAHLDSPAPRAMIVLRGLGQAGGIVLFVVNMWTRVRMPAAAPPVRERS